MPVLDRTPETTSEAPATQEQESPASLARFILTLALIAWALRSFIVAPFSIPSGSMLPTLYIGDYLIVAKWPYGYSKYSFPFQFPPFDGRVLGHDPERGDVVVFRHPSNDLDLIKRIIAIPGDRIAVTGGIPVLNGVPLRHDALPAAAIPVSPNSPCKIIPPALTHVVQSGDGPRCAIDAALETLPGGRTYTVLDQMPQGLADNFAEAIVPAGHVFLMGDNRDDSLDSRFSAEENGIGMVPVDHLIGRALVTFWSTDGSADYLKPWTWFSALRAERIGNGYHGTSR